MPTIFIVNSLRFFFYSNENSEPAPVHIMKGGANEKIWLLPEMKGAYLPGFSSSGAKEIENNASLNIDLLIKKWDEYFGT